MERAPANGTAAAPCRENATALHLPMLATTVAMAIPSRKDGTRKFAGVPTRPITPLKFRKRLRGRIIYLSIVRAKSRNGRKDQP